MNDGSFIMRAEASPEKEIKAEKTDKYFRILKAARKVFAKHGFYNSKISDIAKEAKVADGTIYLYFKNKDEILISLFEEEFPKIVEKAKKSLSNADDPLTKLKKFALMYLELVTTDEEVAEIIQVELRQSDKFMKEYNNKPFREYLNVIGSIIEEGQKLGMIRKDLSPSIVKRAFFGALDEIGRYWVLSKKKKYPIEKCVEEVSEIFIRGLAA